MKLRHTGKVRPGTPKFLGGTRDLRPPKWDPGPQNILVKSETSNLNRLFYTSYFTLHLLQNFVLTCLKD